MSIVAEDLVAQAKSIALPSLIGMQIGDTIWDGGWDPYPFLLDIESELVPACMDQSKQDWFILNAPNQIGKTSIAVLLIFWFIGMFPDRQVIFISYSDGYSTETGRLVRDLFKRYGEKFFGLKVDPDNESQGDWSLVGHPSGGMLSVGIGGQITGRQGHLVWIDDILKTMEEAASATTKAAHWSAWQGAIWGRRQPGSTYVVASTCLADDDLSGRLKAQQDAGGGIPWKRLVYPGICYAPDDWEGDPADYRDRLGRAPGDPLHTRFSQPTDTPENNWWKLAEVQLKNPQLFDCMIQQNPNNSDTGMFPVDRWVKLPRADWPERFVSCRSWDIAETEGGGDWTVGVMVSKAADGRVFIDGRYRKQVGPEQGILDVKSVAGADGYHVPVLIEEEKGGAAKKLVEFYRQHLPGFQVIGTPVDGSKEVRATTYSILQKGRQVVLPADEEDEEWVEPWVKTHKLMMGDGRRPKHDDEIDAAAHAIRYLVTHDAAEYADVDGISDERMFELQQMLADMGL